MEYFEFEQLNDKMAAFRSSFDQLWWVSGFEKIFGTIVFHRLISEKTLQALESFDVYDFNSYKEIWNSDKQEEVKSLMIEKVQYILPPELSFFHLVNELKINLVDDVQFYIDFFEEIYMVNVDTPAEVFFNYIFRDTELKFQVRNTRPIMKYDDNEEIAMNLRRAILFLSEVVFHNDAVMNYIALISGSINKYEIIAPLMQSIVENHHEARKILDIFMTKSMFVSYDKGVKYFADIKGDAFHTYALLFLQGVSSENIKLRKFQSDKWLEKVVEDETVDTIISSFDTQMSWDPAKELLNDSRFSGPGKLVTQHRGEWAYIQNGLSQLDENGLMIICMGQGPLYRMINEAVVRQYLVETENVIDTIIALPKNVGSTFRHQSCLVIFKKNRQQNDILFIDSSTFIENYINGSTTLNQLKQKVNDIINDRVNIEKISYVAPFDEIDNNNFNLNIAKYIKSDDLENTDGLQEVELDDIRDEIAQLENKIDNKMSLLNKIIN